MKHYGRYLPSADRLVRLRSEELESKMNEKEELLKKIEALDSEIVKAEMEFCDIVAEDWTNEEISEAQQKAYDYNTSIRLKR